MDVIKVPGPDHPITVSASPSRLEARHDGRVIADSAAALIVEEASYRPVPYFPREDIDMARLKRTDLDTYCPYKGHASYFSIEQDGEVVENAAWTYETPHPAMAVIAGRIAFYPNLVTLAATPIEREGPSVDWVVQHTDSGSGRSQGDHWPPTVEDPA